MLACIVLAFSLGMVSGAGHANIYPESANSAAWGGPTGKCATGTRQSPIDLDSSMVATVHSPITYKNYFNGHFNKHHKGLLVGHGCEVVWYPNHKSTTKVMGGKNWRTHCPNIRDGPYGGMVGPRTHAYYLWQLHFHWGTVGDDTKGSEHTINGKQYPLEMHMVHVEDEYIGPNGEINSAGAKGDPHGLAVLAILFKVVHKKPQNMEPLEKIDDEVWEFHYHNGGHRRSAEEIEDAELDHYHNLNMRSLSYGFSKIMEATKETRSSEPPKVMKHKLKLNIGAFIRKATRNGADKTMSTYWTYKGSLTTPDCNEAVTWVVFERRLHIAQVQANAFASLCPDQFRTNQTIDMGPMGHMVQHLIHKPVTKG